MSKAHWLYLLFISLLSLAHYWWASERFAKNLNLKNLHSSRPPSYILALISAGIAVFSFSYLLFSLSL